MKPYIVDWNGKSWLRMGECTHCGECCTFGYVKPCPELIILPDYTGRCNIYERRDDYDDPKVLETCGVHTTACSKFPRDPGDLNNEILRNRCTYYFVPSPKIFLFCPTYEGKAYCFEEWAACVKALTYPNLDILIVDNSRAPDYSERIKAAGFNCVWLGTELYNHPVSGISGLDRICRSMEYGQQVFKEGNYTHWFNLEADNTIPPDGLQLLLKYGMDVDWTSHCYPAHGSNRCMQQGIGCSLLSRKLMTDYDWALASDSPDAELWNFVEASNGAYKSVELWEIMKVGHLNG